MVGESSFVRQKIREYNKDKIIFTKSRILDWLCKRNNSTVNDMKKEVLSLNDLVFVEKQQIKYGGNIEERFKCYFVYSKNKGRCYVLKFNKQIKIITVFPLGRTTLKRYRKKFK